MTENSTSSDRRVDARVSNEQYYSVQFTKRGLGVLYHFKIWNIHSKGMCILVRHDSMIMNHLKVWDILDMQYYSEKGEGPIDLAKTQIKHITKNKQGRFKGHYLVGLFKLGTITVLESQTKWANTEPADKSTKLHAETVGGQN